MCEKYPHLFSTVSISSYEIGAKTPSLEMLLTISKTFHVSLDWLCGLSNTQSRKGEIKNFTGIDSPYERPLNPDITVNTANKSISECSQMIVDTIKMRIKE